MAVQTSPINHNLFSPQVLINNNGENQQQQQHFYNMNMIDSSSSSHQSFFPFQQSLFYHQQPNSDSTLTFHNTKKRLREDSISDQSNHLQPLFKTHKPSIHHQNLHFHSHHSEIDLLISQHMEKVRMEIEEQKTKQTRMLLYAIQEAVVKKLKEKEEEINNIGKYNLVLQEKVKSLIMENQIWREMAMTNETAVNTLRNELEKVLAHVRDNHHRQEEEAESSCSSNHHGDAVAVEEGGGEETTSVMVVGKMCNSCGVRESVVLLLPCRHLCLCTVCGTHIRNCPLCFSAINASVHVNFS